MSILLTQLASVHRRGFFATLAPALGFAPKSTRSIQGRMIVDGYHVNVQVINPGQPIPMPEAGRSSRVINLEGGHRLFLQSERPTDHCHNQMESIVRRHGNGTKIDWAEMEGDVFHSIGQAVA